MNQNKGFTLIEMLVVVAIIGLLSSVVLTGLGSARVKARDARRLSDIRHIQNALEIFYSDADRYPITTGSVGVESLLTSMPQDPQQGSYQYLSLNNDQGYVLGSCLEQDRPVGTPHASNESLAVSNANTTCNCDGGSGGDSIYCVEG